MTYEEISAVIQKKITDVLMDDELEHIDLQKSIKDYGFDSVDIVVIISSAMKELKIDAPGEDLMSCDTIDDLILTLLKYSEKQ